MAKCLCSFPYGDMVEAIEIHPGCPLHGTTATLERTLERVVEYAEKYRGKWLDKDDNYWLQRLMQEVGEAASVMAGDHADSLEHEIRQIGSISINWLRAIRRRNLMIQLGRPTKDDLQQGCDCQAPHASPALVSNDCPVHG